MTEDIACILLDLDGTLQDSERLATECNRVGFRMALGREATEEELEGLVGKPIAKIIGLLYPGDGERIFEYAIRHYEGYWSTISLYEGVRDMLEELNRLGYRLGIVSSKRRYNVVRELEHHGLLELFGCIVGQEDTVDNKPHPAPLLLAARMLDVDPAACVYIGDQPSDLIAAAAAGMKRGAALWGEGKRGLMEKVGADQWFETPDELLNCCVSTIREKERVAGS